MAAILRTRSARTSGAGKNLFRLLVEHQAIVAEMRSANMLMKIPGLQIEHECVGEQPIDASLMSQMTDRSGVVSGSSTPRSNALTFDIAISASCSRDRCQSVRARAFQATEFLEPAPAD